MNAHTPAGPWLLLAAASLGVFADGCAMAQGTVHAPRAAPATFAPAAARALPATIGVWGVVQRDRTACDAPPLHAGASGTGGHGLPEGDVRLKVGAGFVIDGDGHAVTAAHVVAGCSRVAVELWDQRVVIAEKVAEDRAADVALLKLPVRLRAPALRSAPLRPGDWVLAVGHPYGLNRSLGIGIVAALDRHFPDDGEALFIQSDLALNVGSSGGPLLDASGAIAGMNVRAIAGSQGSVAGLSLPIAFVLQTVADLRREDAEPRPRLGAQFDDLPPPAALAFGLKRADGALITLVQPGSIAERFALQEGDLVLGMNGRLIRNSADFARALLAWSNPGSTRLMVLRDGRYRELSLASPQRQSADVEARQPRTARLE